MKNIFQSSDTIWNLTKDLKIKSDIKESDLVVTNSILIKIFDLSNSLINYTKNIKSRCKNKLILKNYELYQNKDFVSKSYIVIWFKRLIYSNEQFLFFLNLPTMISIIALEIIKNIKNKTIYLYQIILMLALPVAIYRIQKNISIQTHKNCLEYIICENRYDSYQNNTLRKKDISKTASALIDKIYKSKYLTQIENKEKIYKKNLEGNRAIELKRNIEFESINKETSLRPITETVFYNLSKSKNNDYNRILNNLTNKRCILKYIIYNKYPLIKNEWNCIEKLFYDISKLNNNLYLLKDKKIIDTIFYKTSYKTTGQDYKKYITDKINKSYVIFIQKTNRKNLSYSNINNLEIFRELKNKFKEDKKINLIEKFNDSVHRKLLQKIIKNIYKLRYLLIHYANSNSNILENKKNTQDFLLLLDRNRRRWRYKLNESIKINYNNKINNFKKINLPSILTDLTITQKIEIIINDYLQYYKSNILYSIIKSTKIVNKEIDKNINNIFINRFKLTKTISNNNNIKEYTNDAIYIPYNILKNTSNKHIEIENIIKKIHFTSYENVRDTLLYEKRINQKSLIKRLSNTEIKDLISLKDKDIRKIHLRFNNITSKILYNIEKLNKPSILNVNKHLQIIYRNVFKTNKNFVLQNKNFLLSIKNIHVQTKYIQKFNLDYNESKNWHILEEKKVISHKSTNIYKTLNELIFFTEPSIFEKYKTKENINSYVKNNNLITIKLSVNDKNFDIKTQIFKTFKTIFGINVQNKEYKSEINKLNILEQYNKWIFTSQWWLLFNKVVVNKIPKITQNLLDNQKITFDSKMINIFSNIKNKQTQFSNASFLDYRVNILEKLRYSNKILLKEIYKSSNKDISIWDANYINRTTNLNQWACFGWFITICILYYHWFSIFSGTPYIYIWYQFEKMRSLANPCSNTILNILVHNSIESPSQQLRLTMYSSAGWILWLKGKIFSYLIQQKFFSNLFFNTNCVDIPRKKKNLVINYLITEQKLLRYYKLWNSNLNKFINNQNIFHSTKYEGLSYLQKWSRMSFRYPRLIEYKKNYSENFQWLNELYFFGDNLNSVDIEKIPRNLPEPIVEKKRWLIVGTLETGKSLLIKSIASDTHFPVVHISLKDIRHATPDEKYNKFKNSNKWVQQLSDRAFLLENALQLAKMLSPSIFWISDIHEFHANSAIEKKENKIDDTSFLFFMLLKMMTNDLLPSNDNKIILIGSTDSPALLDPKFVSRHRLDFIVNLRKYYFHQRQNFLVNILQNNNLDLAGKRAFCELGSNTIGYSVRDLTGFANEILLIQKQTSTKTINTDIIRLALYRQSSKQSTNNAILENQSRKYKIGKAIIQSTLLHSKPMLPLNVRHELWKNRFYYLHNVFLEKPIEKSTITELSAFVHLINCLSGSAARDASVFSKKKLNQENIHVNKQLEHDFSIASHIVQSILLEFPLREIYDLHFSKNKLSIYNFRQIYNMNIMQKTIYSLNFFNRFASYTYWSYRMERLSLTWALLFDNIQTSNKPINSRSYFQFPQQTIGSKTKQEEIHIYGPYEKKRIREQNKYTRKIHAFFNQIMFEHNLKTIDFPWVSEYILDYNALQLSILLLDTKALWDPPALKPYYSVFFFNRDLLVNRNILTKFYITYGEKFQNQKLNPKRIKEQLLWPKITQENSNVAENSSNKEETSELRLEDFDSFRQLAKPNSYFQSSQIEGRFYLYQSWNDPDYEENFRYSDLLSERKNLENSLLQYRELLIYGTLLEIYYHLFRFFFQNQSFLREIEEKLIQKGVIDREYIEKIVKKTKFL